MWGSSGLGGELFVGVCLQTKILAIRVQARSHIDPVAGGLAVSVQWSRRSCGAGAR